MLNHCFDDIEKFIVRLQHAFAATRELQTRKKQAKRAAAAATAGISGAGPLSPTQQAPLLSSAELALLGARARGPSEDDYYEILSKFKLAFNLLAKLKGCIHEPNAPELIHFLFTPLAIIIESARNGKFATIKQRQHRLAPQQDKLCCAQLASAVLAANANTPFVSQV